MLTAIPMTIFEALCKIGELVGYTPDLSVIPQLRQVLQDLWDTAEEQGRGEGQADVFGQAQIIVGEIGGEWNHQEGG